MSSENIILKLWKTPHHLPSKFANAVQKQTFMWMVTVTLSALFKKHLLVQLLRNVTMVLLKTISKKVTIIILDFLGINLVRRTLNCLIMYGNWNRKILTVLLIGILLQNHRIIFLDLESVIYTFVRSFLLQEQIRLFCLINMMSLFQNAGREINLLWCVLKINKIIYIILCI